MEKNTKFFNEKYKSKNTPWELGKVDSNLVKIVTQNKIKPCNALEIGCGTGDNAIWLRTQGFKVTATDFSDFAIKKAKKKSESKNIKIDFVVNDFFKTSFKKDFCEFVFDRGCFHSFDSNDDRKKIAENISSHIKKNGFWLSFIGNKDEKRKKDEIGPPQRSAGDIINAVEPFFKIIFLVSDYFDSKREKPPKAWICLMQKR